MRYIYMIQCADDTLYTGITTNIERRISEHNTGIRGAIYTRSRRPVKLVRSERVEDRSQASQREYQIKKYTKAQKIALFS